MTWGKSPHPRRESPPGAFLHGHAKMIRHLCDRDAGIPGQIHPEDDDHGACRYLVSTHRGSHPNLHRLGSARIGSDQLGSARIGSDQLGSIRLSDWPYSYRERRICLGRLSGAPSPRRWIPMWESAITSTRTPIPGDPVESIEFK